MDIICALSTLYTYVIIGRAIASFFPVNSDSPFAPVVRVLWQLTEPVLQPVRRVLPTTGPFDFSPLVVLIGIQLVAGLLGC
jgi:YggT family protein